MRYGSLYRLTPRCKALKIPKIPPKSPLKGLKNVLFLTKGTVLSLEPPLFVCVISTGQSRGRARCERQ